MEVCDAALDLPPNEREPFITRECAADPHLRQEVDALLAHTGIADRFLEAPVDGVAARLATVAAPFVGRQIGVYRITSFLGAGGMGEVYRARDTQLGRDVAVK